MTVTEEDDSIVYVTLVEAAEKTGESLRDLQRAVRQQQIRGIRENPENKRSRWLVALEDVRKFSQESPSELPEKPAVDSSVTEEIVPTDSDGGRDSARSELVHTEAQAPDDPSLSADEDRESKPANSVTDQPVAELPHLPSSVRESPLGSMATGVPGRGEELLTRLTRAIDRLSDNVVETPFDYQALLDKYVVAVEERAEAEVRTATLQRRLDDLLDQVATHTERLDQSQAQNRQLLAELEIARAERDAMFNRPPADEGRPLWRRRSRQ